MARVLSPCVEKVLVGRGRGSNDRRVTNSGHSPVLDSLTAMADDPPVGTPDVYPLTPSDPEGRRQKASRTRAVRLQLNFSGTVEVAWCHPCVIGWTTSVVERLTLSSRKFHYRDLNRARI